MAACRPNRYCGCGFQSSSLHLSGSGSFGDPLQIETYEGVATEVPDTRPAGPDRFVGMRVYTTDTKRIFLWDGANWRCIQQPLVSFTPTFSGLTLGNGTISAGYSRSGHQVMFQIEFNFGSTSVMAGTVFNLPVPARWTVPAATGGRQMGSAQFYDASAGVIYHGASDINQTDGKLRLYGPEPTAFQISATAPFTWATSDQMWVKNVYDAADTV